MPLTGDQHCPGLQFKTLTTALITHCLSVSPPVAVIMALENSWRGRVLNHVIMSQIGVGDFAAVHRNSAKEACLGFYCGYPVGRGCYEGREQLRDGSS